MNTIGLNFEGIVPLESAYEVNGSNQLVLKTVDGAVPLNAPLFRYPGLIRFSGDITAFSAVGTTLGSIYLFPVINGIPMFWDDNESEWVPVPASLPRSAYPSIGIPLNALDITVRLAHLIDGRTSFSFGVALSFVSDGVTSPALTSLSFMGPNAPVANEFHLTRVHGSFPVSSHLDAPPKSFFVELRRRVVLYNGNPISFRKEVIVDPTTGAWEVWLPDTESMGDRLDAYDFYIKSAYPLTRKVPKVADIAFGDLPVTNGA